ncbi:MAG: two-component system sensor histidine kinase NtrB [Desulfatibacillaceae bacterium]
MRTPREMELFCKAADAYEGKLVIVSPEREILAANAHAELLAGEPVVGRKCHEVFQDSDSRCRECPGDAALRNQKTAAQRRHEHGVRLEDDICLYALPIQGDGGVEAFCIADLDITTLGGLEGLLARSNSFLTNLIMSSVDAVIAADKKGNILIFNDAAVEISGYTAQEAMCNLNIRDVYPEDMAYAVMAKMREEGLGGKGKVRGLLVEIMRKDGGPVPISLNASIVYDEHGKEVATIGFFHDMRETLAMRKELQNTQIQLLQADKMASLGKLAAGVAHQLNNPLGGVILFSQLLLEEYDLPDGAVQDLRRVLEDAQRCRETVKELLEFARQTRQEVRPHDINQALRRTLYLLENQARFQNIEVVYDLDESLDNVPADIQQLNHVFMNIVMNAAEAMRGSGTLSISTRRDEDGRNAVIEIADTGPGIPEDVLPHVFEPFYTTREDEGGTGLGLSLAYSIVENHHGRIVAGNREDGQTGAVFTIRLPLEYGAGPGAFAR